MNHIYLEHYQLNIGKNLVATLKGFGGVFT